MDTRKLENAVERGIRAVLGKSGCPEWEVWAERWMSGEDRMVAAARAAKRTLGLEPVPPDGTKEKAFRCAAYTASCAAVWLMHSDRETADYLKDSAYYLNRARCL